MIYSLYLRRSIKYYKLYYIITALIITISMFTISIVNIYFDSLSYGRRLKTIEMSNGYHFWLEGAEESDLNYFAGTPNLETIYENNVIYVKLLNNYSADKMRIQLSDISTKNGLNINLRSFIELYNDDFGTRAFDILKIVITIIGGISIFYIYGFFIRNRKTDIGVLISLGINIKQLKRLLMLELVVIFAFSYILALLISNISMSILITNFLHLNNENLTYAVVTYIFSFKSSILLLVLSFLSVFFAFYVYCKNLTTTSVSDIIKTPQNYGGFNRHSDIWKTSSPVCYLTKTSIIRNKRYFLGCTINVLPVAVIVIFLTNCIAISNTPVNESSFFIGTSSIEIYDNPETTYSNIDKLNKIDGIKNIKQNIFEGNYYIRVDTTKKPLKNPIHTSYQENHIKEEFYRISIEVLPEYYLDGSKFNYNGDITVFSKDNHILLPKEMEKKGYNIGDELPIYYKNNNIAKLKVVGFTDYPSRSYAMQIYVTKDNFEKLTGKPAIPSQIEIFLDENADVDYIREKIFGIFSNNNIYNIIDNIKMGEDSRKVFRGMSFTVSFIGIALSICSTISLYFYIIFVISTQKQQIYILLTLGAKSKQIINIYVFEALIKGAVIALAGVSLGILLTYITVLRDQYSLSVNFILLIKYLLICAIIITVHTLPAYITTRNLIKQRSNGNDDIKN